MGLESKGKSKHASKAYTLTRKLWVSHWSVPVSVFTDST